jgi:diguanylate cyclase (GGDEF)-like protein/PAS domain S-box-containing protein
MRKLSTRYALFFTALVTALLAVAVGLAGTGGYRLLARLKTDLHLAFAEAHSFKETEALGRSARYLSNRLFDALYRSDVSLLNEEIEQIRSWLPVREFLILDAEARIVTDGTHANPRYGQRVPLPRGLSPGAHRSDGTGAGTLLYFVVGFGDEVAGYARVSLSDEAYRDSLRTLVARIEAHWVEFKHALAATALLGFAGLLALVPVLSWRLSRSLSRPLVAMSRAAGEFASGNLEHALAVGSDDEIGGLARALNTMALDLRKSNRLLAKSQEMAHLGSWEWHLGSERLAFSAGIYRILGATEGGLQPTLPAFLELVVSEDRATVRGIFEHPALAPVGGEFRIRRRSGETRILLLQGEPLASADARPQGYIGILQDVTEQRRSERTLARLANFDPLTGLPNRNLFQDRLHHAIAQARRDGSQIALLYLDLDRFKEINDALGHTAGDELLKRVAKRLLQVTRESDTLARLGGDEFTLVLARAGDTEGVARVAHKLLGALRRPFRFRDRELYVSASIGITLYPRDGQDLSTLLRNADTAMYLAKDHGKGTYRFFTADLNRRANERLALEHALRRAVRARAFVFYYQPQVLLASGKLVGFEALVRLQGAEGLIPPSRFVPVLEDTGQIAELTGWTLETVCAQLRTWHATIATELRVAVNLSALQFRQPDLVPLIAETLRRNGLPGHCLEVEITESTLLDPKECEGVARELQALGVRLSIDDFGTGYSSLSYLKRYHVDALKIDRAFVSPLPQDQDAGSIAAAVIALCKRLGIEAIAEGVETPEQMEFLRQQGCELIQGFLLGVPLAATEVAAWAQAQQLVDAGCYWRAAGAAG